MRFGVLGPLSVEADDGVPVILPRPSQRATLAVLLLLAPGPVPGPQLIDALWGEDAPDGAGAALRVRISEVRRALAGRSGIQTLPAGYRILAGPGEVDAEVFGTLATRGGRRSTTDGRGRRPPA